MKTLMILPILTILCSCGSVKASSTAYTEQVSPPQGFGATLYCFVVRDEDGKAVGGNCIPRP